MPFPNSLENNTEWRLLLTNPSTCSHLIWPHSHHPCSKVFALLRNYSVEEHCNSTHPGGDKRSVIYLHRVEIPCFQRFLREILYFHIIIDFGYQFDLFLFNFCPWVYLSCTLWLHWSVYLPDTTWWLVS